ncbi:succinate dehydrogenase assembly factor 2 [Eikenella sp. S3360]|uniref:FAD assembly factor SdhE n=1 Tax=Eikenella glucosivorans TaxID=2766967 RepID=A0ABS0NBY9_9NEIS|nr:succinate dehydrogenase assembly factor 2 [Eikenella glucosivorans]MBH5329769.1 succinate dehydrogenase assembly factor 2 [Eikenella glucosivorans]
MTRFDDTAKRRIRFQTRRGLLELDILLQRFMAEEFERLSDAELAVFTELLALPDPELFAQINGQTETASAEAAALIGKIRSSRAAM